MSQDSAFDRLPPPERPAFPLAPADSLRAAFPAAEESAADALPLAHYLSILRRQRWKILAFVAVSVTATFVISRRITPIYEATAMIDIDRRLPSAVLEYRPRLGGIAPVRVAANDYGAPE